MWTGVDPGSSADIAKPVTLMLAGSCPVRSSASLRLALRSGGLVHVAIYDVSGRRVRTLLDGWVPAGVTTLAWDVRAEQGGVASGIYFARAMGACGRSVVRIPLLR